MIKKRQQLRRRILSKYDTLGMFAEDLGISRQSVSNIVSGHTYPRAKTMAKMREKLDIRDDEVGTLF